MAKDKKVPHRVKKIFNFILQIFQSFFKDNCINLSAAIAYYITFSLPPLFILIILITSLFFNPNELKGTIYQQMQGLVGPQGAKQIQSILENASQPGTGNTFTIIISIIAILFTASGTFISIQNALNASWNVMRNPKKKGGKKNIFFLSACFP